MTNLSDRRVDIPISYVFWIKRFSTVLPDMKFIFTVFILVNFSLVSVDALLADGSKFEAKHGEDVTIPFTMDKVEEADRSTIIFTSETTKKSHVIAQRCAGSVSCDVVETPGVKLLVGHGHVNVTIQKVDSSRSGLYEARALFGKDVSEMNATLVVNEASSSSTPKPPNSSNLLGLCALIPIVISVGRLLL